MRIGVVVPVEGSGRESCDFSSLSCKEMFLTICTTVPTCEEMEEESVSNWCFSLSSMDFD